MITETNNIRLSNDPAFWESRNIFSTSNTYSGILSNTGNIIKKDSCKTDRNIESAANVIKLIYDNRTGMLFMNREVFASVSRLTEIGRLPYDWNGYGARPFSAALIDKCIKIVNTLSHQPEIYPTGRQSIQFQYQLEDRSYLEFEIYENKTMCLLVPKRIYANAVEIEITDSEEEQIKEKVDNFYGRNRTEKRNIIQSSKTFSAGFDG